MMHTQIKAGLIVLLATALLGSACAQEMTPLPFTADAVNSSDLSTTLTMQQALPAAIDNPEPQALAQRNPALVKLQTLLDQHGASPGVIDGFDGDNLRKAVIAFQIMAQLPATGMVDAALLGRLDLGQSVMGTYQISPEDAGAITAATPADYADKAKMEFLGYESVAELLAERFHMDRGLLADLNPGAQFLPGDTITAVLAGQNAVGVVTLIEADKQLRQVRAYDAQGMLLAAYPATIGSQDNPSPSGSYLVKAVAPLPNYTYNPAINFQQGDNSEVLTIPPGPNGPVGSMWIALSKPTYGIHGTPEPSLIDKTGSHGCVRLTNWDAEELASMVSPGVEVIFL